MPFEADVPSAKTFHRAVIVKCTLALLSAIAVLMLASVSLADDLKRLDRVTTAAEKEYQNGFDALKQNRLNDAEASFQKSYQLDPKLANSSLGLAEVHMRRGDTAGAGPYFERAAKASPTNVELQAIWGHYLFFRGRYDEAEKVLQHAIQMNPYVPRPHYEIADLYLLGLNRPADAAAAYRDAIRLQPKDSRLHYSLANALAESGRLDDAQSELETAIRLAPADALLLKAYGDFLLRRNKQDEALRAYTKSIEISPKFLPARFAQGDLLTRQKKFDAAIASYEGVLKISPRSSEALVRMGLTYEAQQRWSDAEREYTSATEVDPKSAVAFNNLAWLLSEHEGQPARALPLGRQAVALAPNNADCHDTLGWILKSTGDNPGAVAALKRAAELAPKNPEILYHLGVAYQQNGENGPASQSLEKALALNSSFTDAADARRRIEALKTPH